MSGKALETVDQESKEDFLQFTSSSFVHRPNFRLVSDEALHQFLGNANAWHAGILEHNIVHLIIILQSEVVSHGACPLTVTKE